MTVKPIAVSDTVNVSLEEILASNANKKLEGGEQLTSCAKSIDPSKPLISIVTVVFNGEEFLKDAIESVLNQSYQGIELIIIDGGSSDSSVDIIKGYGNKIDYWVSEKDEGQSDAFIKGFNKCRGEWLTWLNADDLLLPNAIQNLVENARKFPDVGCFTGNIIWTDAHDRILQCRKGERWSNLLPENGILNVYGPTTFFKSSLYKSVKGLNRDLHYQMDTDLWWQFYKSGASFKRMDQYIWVLRVHENAKTTAQYFDSSESSDPNHISRLNMNKEKMYIHSSYDIQISEYGKFLLATFRAFSFKYISSMINSYLYKGKDFNKLLKGKK